MARYSSRANAFTKSIGSRMVRIEAGSLTSKPRLRACSRPSRLRGAQKESRLDQLYKPSSGTGERLEVGCIGCYNRISVRREQNERGIDDVALPCSCEKLASAFAEVLAEGPHIDAGEGLCQKG